MKTQISNESRILISGQKLLIFLMLYQLLLPILLLIWLSTFRVTDHLEMSYPVVWDLVRILCPIVQFIQVVFVWQLVRILKFQVQIWEWVWLMIMLLPIFSYGELRALYLKLNRKLEEESIETSLMHTTRSIKTLVDRKIF